MALAVGTGPFGRQRAGTFSFGDVPDHALYLEPTPRRVRVVVAGEVVAESTRAALLHETGEMPRYLLPVEDVRTDVVEEAGRTEEHPHKGEAAYLTLRVGGEVRTCAAWTYPLPAHGAGFLAGYVAFDFDAIDEWWEETERIGVHPRDPYHRCDVVRSDRHVVVRVGEQVLADSRRPTMLFETGLPPRFYLPTDDVRLDLLTVTGTQTSCPYKGTTSRYYTAEAAGRRLEDVAWTYDDVHAEVTGIEGLVAFYDEKVDVTVDGDAWSG